MIKEQSRVLHDRPDPETLKKYYEGEGDDLDEIDPIQMEPDHETDHVPKKPKTDFSLNVYCVYFDEHKQFVMNTLHEVNNCDGVFIIVETNFEVPQI